MKKGEKKLIIGIIIVLLIIGGIYFYIKSTEGKCVQAGENRAINEECCLGLESLEVYADDSCTGLADSIYTCSDCGNGNCESWENKCSCSKDCR